MVVCSALVMLFAGCAKDYDDQIKNLEVTMSTQKAELLKQLDDQYKALDIAYKLADNQVEKNALAAAKEEVAALKAWVTEQLGNYVTQTQFSDFKDAYNTKVGELTSAIALINNNIAILPTLTADVGTLQNQMSTAQSDISNAKTSISDISNTLTTATRDITQLSNDLNTSNNNITILNNDIQGTGGILDQIGGINDQIAGVGGINERIGSINDWCSTTNDWVNTTCNDLTNMTRDIDNNTNAINTINGTLTNVNTALNDLNKALYAPDGIGTTLGIAVSDVETAKRDIAALEDYMTQLLIWQGKVSTTSEVWQYIAEAEARANTRIDDNKFAIDNLQNNYNSLMQMYTDLASEVGNAAGMAGFVEGRVAQVEQQMNFLQENVSQLQGSINICLNSIDLLHDRLTIVEEDVTVAKDNIAALQYALNNPVDGLLKRVDDLEEGLDALDTRVTALETTVGDAGSGLVKQVNDLDGAVTALGNRLTAAETTIAELMARIQSIVYVPRFDDGKATLVISYNSGDPVAIEEVELDFLISPAAAAADIVAAYKADETQFGILVNEVATRTIGTSAVTFGIEDIVVSTETPGVITVKTKVNIGDYSTFVGTYDPISGGTKALQVALGLTSQTGKDTKITQFVGVYVKTTM